MPVPALTVWCISSFAVISRSPRLKPGNTPATRVDHAIAPVATSRDIIRVVSAFVVEPIMNRVVGVTACGSAVFV